MQTGLYRHYKGCEYRVLGTVRHSETEEELVLYRALYGDCGLWVRPIDLFDDRVDVEGRQVPRFTLIKAENYSLDTD